MILCWRQYVLVTCNPIWTFLSGINIPKMTPSFKFCHRNHQNCHQLLVADINSSEKTYEDIFKTIKTSSACQKSKIVQRKMNEYAIKSSYIGAHKRPKLWLNINQFHFWWSQNRTQWTGSQKTIPFPSSFRSFKIISNISAGDQNLFLAKWILTRMEKIDLNAAGCL